MAGELPRPGVEVLQTFRSASPSFTRPSLVPCIVGAAYEIINVLDSEGAINSKAKFGEYAQLSKTITQSSFPDPRGNIDELNIEESSIRPFILMGGQLSELPLDPYGEGFLMTHHKASKATMKSKVFGAGGLALNGKVLVVAFDQPVRIDTSDDLTITFSGSGNLTATQAADQINSAVGKTVATVEGSSPNEVVVLTSTKTGAMSSITVRIGGSANSVLELGFAAATSAEERVEGAGWAGQDDSDNDTLTPWIEFKRGGYILNGAADTDGVASRMGFTNLSNEFSETRPAAVTFGDSGTIPLKVGDYVYADGTRVKSAEVTKVEGSRFKLGTINPALSTANDQGRYTSKVYTTAEVATLLADDPFAPSYVYFRANGLDDATAVPTAAVVTGSVSGTAATAGSVTGATLTDATDFPMALAGLTLHYTVTEDGVATEGTFTFTGGPFATMAAVVTAIGSNIPGVIATAEVPGAGTSALKLSTSTTGRLQTVTIESDGTSNATLGFSDSADTSGTGTDVEFSGLTGQTLSFKMNENPHTYSVTFADDSLDLAVEEINTLVGSTVAAIAGASDDQLSLTSTLEGVASQVLVSAGDATTTLGLATTAANGTGRPAPDAFLDDTNSLIVNSELLRDQVTGYPLDQDNDKGTLYIQYKGLRKDVSAVAEVAGVLRIPDTDTLESVLDPINEDNPLALGMFMCLINAPGLEIKGLGIDEVSAAAPDGTELAWSRAAGFLEAEEVYVVAPLTQNEVVHSIWATHVVAMSEPEQGGERIAFINKVQPTRKNSIIAASGTQSNSTATNNQLLLDVNPASGLVAADRNPALPLTYDDGVYVEVEVDDELRRYLVSSVSGSLANLTVTFASGENEDGFFTTTALTESLINAAWSMKVLGDSLVIPGSNPERMDYSTMSEEIAAANASHINRRLFSVYPDTVKTTIDGIEKNIPGYYACAAIAGMVASQPPQQGFTNFPITGLTGVSGTEKFSKKQLNVMAGGGTYILMQEVVGGAVFCRQQVSTDLSSIETRELSITKVVDFVAKFLRSGVRKFIGTQVVNTELLDTIGTTVQGMLKFLEEAGVINGFNLNNLIQDEDAPDTILLDVTLDVPYPCNYIKLTLVV